MVAMFLQCLGARERERDIFNAILTIRSISKRSLRAKDDRLNPARGETELLSRVKSGMEAHVLIVETQKRLGQLYISGSFSEKKNVLSGFLVDI